MSLENKVLKPSSDNLVDQTIAAINTVDQVAALERVRKLRELYPEAAPESLVGMLIKQKCLQTGAIGQVSSSASIIPEVGVFVSLIFGEAADVTMTAKMQAELVLEIGAAHHSQLNEATKQEALVMVTGLSEGANQLLEVTGARLAQQATTQLKGTTPSAIGVAEIAGQNLLSTYLIGRRANTYFKLGSEAVATWTEEVVVAAEEATLTHWLNETTQRSWHLVVDSTLNLTDVAIVAGKAIGEVFVVKATDLALSQQVQRGLAATTAAAANLPQNVTSGVEKLGSGVLVGAELAGKVATEAGRGLAKGVELATGLAGDMSRKAGQVVATGLGKLGQLVSGVLQPEQQDKDEEEG